MSVKALKVSEVNSYIKRLLLTDMILSNISIEGEISNFNHHYSGHMYFNLKDEKGRIKSVMFKRDNLKLDFTPKEGMKVIGTGYISLYEKDGEYQLYVRHLKESGQGDLYKEFEKLKKKLDREGLFLEGNKKPIPFMPRNIGVVTSSTGAAVRDIINIINRRCPICNVIVYPSLVQGERAPENICEGLRYLDSRVDIDLIITGRGGGSIEELFAFNDEEVARTIHNLKTPIISAVGHETDFTIADFVSDLRAPTPSAAAELAVPEIRNLLQDMDDKYNKLAKNVFSQINGYKIELKHLDSKIKYFNPINNLKNKKRELDTIFKDLNYLKDKIIESKKMDLISIKGKLDLLDPILGLKQGYGILIDQDNKLVKSISELTLNDRINIFMRDGKLEATINNIETGDIVDG